MSQLGIGNSLLNWRNVNLTPNVEWMGETEIGREAALRRKENEIHSGWGRGRKPGGDEQAAGERWAAGASWGRLPGVLFPLYITTRWRCWLSPLGLPRRFCPLDPLCSLNLLLPAQSWTPVADSATFHPPESQVIGAVKCPLEFSS